MSLLDLVLGSLGHEQTRQISQHVGAEPSAVERAIQVALPLLVSALARNSAQPQGASALNNALAQHSGQALDRLREGGEVNVDEGRSILSHVFGNGQEQAAQAVSRSAGLNGEQAMTLLASLAPVVMGALGRQKQQQNLDAQGVASELESARASVPQKMPGAAGLLSGLMGSAEGGALDHLSGLLGGTKE